MKKTPGSTKPLSDRAPTNWSVTNAKRVDLFAVRVVIRRRHHLHKVLEDARAILQDGRRAVERVDAARVVDAKGERVDGVRDVVRVRVKRLELVHELCVWREGAREGERERAGGCEQEKTSAAESRTRTQCTHARMHTHTHLALRRLEGLSGRDVEVARDAIDLQEAE